MVGVRPDPLKPETHREGQDRLTVEGTEWRGPDARAVDQWPDLEQASAEIGLYFELEDLIPEITMTTDGQYEFAKGECRAEPVGIGTYSWLDEQSLLVNQRRWVSPLASQKYLHVFGRLLVAAKRLVTRGGE